MDGRGLLLEGKSAFQLLEETIQEMETYMDGLIHTSFITKYPFDAQLNPERVAFYTDALKTMLKEGKRDD